MSARLRVVADHERAPSLLGRITQALLPARHRASVGLLRVAGHLAPESVESVGRDAYGQPVARLIAVGTSQANAVQGLVETARTLLEGLDPEPAG